MKITKSMRILMLLLAALMAFSLFSCDTGDEQEETEAPATGSLPSEYTRISGLTFDNSRITLYAVLSASTTTCSLYDT